MRGALQLGTRVKRCIPGHDLASYYYVKTGVYGTFEVILRAYGWSSTSSFFLYMFCDALDLTQAAYLDSPDRGKEKRRPASTVCCSLYAPSCRRAPGLDF